MSSTKNIHQTRKLIYQPLKKNENNFLFLSNDILISKDMHFNDFIFFGFMWIQWYSGSVQNSLIFTNMLSAGLGLLPPILPADFFQSVQSFQLFLNIFQSVQNFQIFPKKSSDISKALIFSIHFSELAKFPDINFFTIRAGLL